MHLPIPTIKHPRPIHLIILKPALKHLPIGQPEHPNPGPIIIHKAPTVKDPVTANLPHIPPVEGFSEFLGAIVPELPTTIEEVVTPVALIGDIAVLVEELAVALHLVFVPLALVVAAVGVGELAEALPVGANFVALVFAAVVVALADVLGGGCWGGIMDGSGGLDLGGGVGGGLSCWLAVIGDNVFRSILEIADWFERNNFVLLGFSQKCILFITVNSQTSRIRPKCNFRVRILHRLLRIAALYCILS